MEKTYEKVVEIFKEYEHRGEPVIVNSINDDLYGDLGLDSLAVIELIMMCEYEFNIAIDDDRVSKLRTVQDIVNVIDRKSNN